MSKYKWYAERFVRICPLRFLTKRKRLVLMLMVALTKPGGFGGNIGHDPHMLYTLSAVQIFAIFDSIHRIDVEKISQCMH